MRGGAGFGPNYDPNAVDDGYEGGEGDFQPAAYQPRRFQEQPLRRGGPDRNLRDRVPRDRDDEDDEDEDDGTDAPTPGVARSPLLIGALACAVLGLAPVAIALAIVALRRYATGKGARTMAATAIVVAVLWTPVVAVYTLNAFSSGPAHSPLAGASVSPSASGSGGSGARPTPTLEPGCAAGETAVSTLYARLKVDPPAMIEDDFKASSRDLKVAASKASNSDGAAAMRTMAQDLDLLVAALDASEPTTDLVNKIDADGKKITAVCAPK